MKESDPGGKFSLMTAQDAVRAHIVSLLIGSKVPLPRRDVFKSTAEAFINYTQQDGKIFSLEALIEFTKVHVLKIENRTDLIRSLDCVRKLAEHFFDPHKLSSLS